MQDKKGMRAGGKNFGYCTDLKKFVKGGCGGEPLSPRGVSGQKM
jgi:hypothetical protein